MEPQKIDSPPADEHPPEEFAEAEFFPEDEQNGTAAGLALTSIKELRRRARDLAQGDPAATVPACLHAQLERILERTTRKGDRYHELHLADSEASLNLKAWADSPAAPLCDSGTLRAGQFLEITGNFNHDERFGLSADTDLRVRLMQPEDNEADARDVDNLLHGGLEHRREALEQEWRELREMLATVRDPRLRALHDAFLDQHGPRFRRTAAARSYHHARRGGLLEHTTQMMRSAVALCRVYPQLNRDLLIAGVLFHDSGKLWETACPERGFRLAYQVRAELLGHISIGIELVNKLWAGLDTAAWDDLQPKSDEVRLHLLHLIASHHGTREFGSPIDPKTPEAFALHYIDNLDAKLEMMRDVYAEGALLDPGVYERQRPFPSNLTAALPAFAFQYEENAAETERAPGPVSDDSPRPD